MAKQDTIRIQLDNKVFIPLGKTVTLNSISAPTYNSRGEIEATSASQTTVTIVPYNIIDERQSYQKFGDLKEGEMDAAVRYDTTVNIYDYFEIEGVNWYVKDIELNYLPDNVVTIVRLSKEQS
jgi:hypothetical protein